MKVMTWNIRLGIQQGLESVAECIENLDPDVVALQEVGRHWIMGPKGDTTAWLAKRLGYPCAVFVPCLRLVGGAEYGHCLLSRYPLAHPRIVALPMHVDEPRRLLLSQCVTPQGKVDIASTHLSHVADRDPQGAVLLQHAKDFSNTAILLGDLNTPQAPWLDVLLQQYLDSDPTHKFTFPAGKPERRIDFILGKGVCFFDTQVADSGDASDHYPVVTRIEPVITSS
jgi:endonuclease/exonuclease/phosphatase family metal-dependent hydrolase